MAISQHKSTNSRARWFSVLAGWSKSDEIPDCYTPFDPEAVNALLQVLGEVFPQDAIEERMDDEPCFISLTALLKALGTDGDGLFDANYRSTKRFKSIVETLRGSIVKEGPRDPRWKGIKVVHFDPSIDLILRSWYEWKHPSPVQEEKEGEPAKSGEDQQQEDGAAEAAAGAAGFGNATAGAWASMDPLDAALPVIMNP